MDSGLSLKFHGQVVVGGQLYSSVSLRSHGLCFGDFWNFSGTLGDWDLCNVKFLSSENIEDFDLHLTYT